MLSDPFVPMGGEKWREGGPTLNLLPVVKKGGRESGLEKVSATEVMDLVQ